jgi:6-phosphogluconate dehydrogenase
MGDKYTFGIIGLGTMGRNLLLNMADHNFKVAGHDKDETKIQLLTKEAAGKANVKGFSLFLQVRSSTA